RATPGKDETTAQEGGRKTTPVKKGCDFQS
ncbi:unnamed protein product, partial [marine sediment metagenome]